MEYTNEYIVNLSKQFSMELQEVYGYILFSLKEPKTANKLYFKVNKTVLELNFFPERYPKVYGTKDEKLRRLLINKYVVLFEVNNNARSS